MNRIVTGYQLGTRAVKKQSVFTKIDFLKTQFLMKLLFLGFFVVILSLFYIWSRVQILQISYDINAANQTQRELIDNNKKLKTELMLIKSPNRLTKIAAGTLNMSTPQQHQLLKLQNSSFAQNAKR